MAMQIKLIVVVVGGGGGGGVVWFTFQVFQVLHD